MTPERWQQIKPLFNAAIDLPAGEREGYLRNACGSDSELLREITSLLAAHEQPHKAFESVLQGNISAALAANGMAPQDNPDERIGMRIGAYRLVERIGRGGMGEVYKAERADEQYRAHVAVKLVRTDQQTGLVAGRFKSERQILAALDHRNIARLIDGGATDEGVPYLVMELVEGQPIDRYCDTQHLSVAERVRLFLQVCAAVSFAHQQLVVHRDLKPSNILVTADGSVKLLDFGIAKLLEPDVDTRAAADATATVMRVMTLEYASPEQVRGQGVTTVSDLYSLGVVLYRLLTGRSPYQTSSSSPQRLAEIVGDVSPTKPSATIATSHDTAATLSSADRKRMQRELRGDLDNVLLKTLRKEPQQRYSSVDQFADDLRRYLAGQPVLARGDAWSYRAAKFATRHKYAVAAGVLFVVSLMAGIVTTAWQARIAAEQTRVAQEEASKQRAVQSFLTALFDKNTRMQPNAAKARNMPVRDVLVEAGQRVQQEFSDTPAVHIEVMNTVARLLLDIDEFEHAGELWRDSARIARKKNLTSSDAYVDALIGTATVARLMGRAEEAIEARYGAVAELDARGDTNSLLRARALSTTIVHFALDPQREIALVTEGVALFRTRYPTQPSYFQAAYSLGQLQRIQGDMQGAALQFKEATRVFQQSGSKDFTNLAGSYAWAAFCEAQLGRMPDALRDYEIALPLLRQHAGPNSILTRVHLGLYAEALHQSGRAKEAQALFDEALTAETLAAPTSAEFDNAGYRGMAYLSEGRPREALNTVDHFAANWLEFGNRFVPSGVQWVVVRARAQAQLGQLDAAHKTLTYIADLPAFNGLRPEKSDEYLAAAIEVALQATDISKAQAALADHGSNDTPATFDLGYVQFSIARAALELRMGDARAAQTVVDTALAHLHQHAGQNGFPHLQAELLNTRGAARLQLSMPDAAAHDLAAAVAWMQAHHAPASPALRTTRALLATIR
jgi:serine/threonine protein kinase/tetratricopeptide (TPR) repeat protein